MAKIYLKGKTETYIFDTKDLLSAGVNEGGMSKVYKGAMASTNEPIAVKVLRKEFKRNRMYVERFRNESSIQFSHPNVVRIYDYVVDKQTSNSAQYAIIMEYMPGKTIKQVLKSGKIFSTKETLHIAKEILQGLRALHNQHEPICHRDTKPGNIMLLDNGGVKVFDFGISKFKKNGKKLESLALTRIGQKVRTPLYATPEQISEGEVGPRTDIFALGTTCYTMLTGKPPFIAKISYELERQIQEDPLPPHPNIAPQVYDILAKATQKNPANRYKNALSFIQAIDKVLERLNEPELPTSIRRSKVSPQVISLIASAIILISLFILYILNN